MTAQKRSACPPRFARSVAKLPGPPRGAARSLVLFADPGAPPALSSSPYVRTAPPPPWRHTRLDENHRRLRLVSFDTSHLGRGLTFPGPCSFAGFAGFGAIPLVVACVLVVQVVETGAVGRSPLRVFIVLLVVPGGPGFEESGVAERNLTTQAPRSTRPRPASLRPSRSKGRTSSMTR